MKLTDEYLVEGVMELISYTPWKEVEKLQLNDKEGNLIPPIALLRAFILIGLIEDDELALENGSMTLEESKKFKENLEKARKELIRILNKKDYLSDKDFEVRYLEKLLELKGQYKPFDELLGRMVLHKDYGIISSMSESSEYKGLVELFCSEELTIENFKRKENEIK